MSLNNILKSDVLNWYLFKSGLKTPSVDQMSHDQALQDGLMAINEGLIKTQEQIFDSLRTLPEDPKVQRPLDRLEPATAARATTVRKSEVVAKKTFAPRKEVWSPEVIAFFDKTGGE